MADGETTARCREPRPDGAVVRDRGGAPERPPPPLPPHVSRRTPAVAEKSCGGAGDLYWLQHEATFVRIIEFVKQRKPDQQIVKKRCSRSATIVVENATHDVSIPSYTSRPTVERSDERHRP